MTDHSQHLAALLSSARRRHLAQLIVEQAGTALGAAFAGAILLLLLGTQILDWYWLVALFVLSLSIGVWRTIHRIPSSYSLAQRIDRALGLHDTLSTAYFLNSSGYHADPELLRYQRNRAEELAAGVNSASVFPLRTPRILYAVAGVALVAFGMFAVRYGVTHSLDLKPSLVKIAFDTFWKQEGKSPAARKTPLQSNLEDQLKKLGINLGTADAVGKQRDASQVAMNTLDAPDAKNAEAGENALAKADNMAVEDAQEGEGPNGAKSLKGAGNEDSKGDEQPGDKAQAAAQNGKQDPSQKNADDQANDKSSMMDRMKDAMSSLLNKLKVQPKSGESQQAGKDSKGAGKSQQAQKGSPTQGKPQDGSDSPEQQGDPQGQGDKSQSAQGKSGDKNADPKASQDAKSGIGKDEGDKSSREAAQLAAMGKISEILGKRAQNLSGELMVEVAGGNQQLKTAYSGSVGKHTEAGGEITRDEVPMIYRDFVQHYFEQIRKTPPAKKVE